MDPDAPAPLQLHGDGHTRQEQGGIKARWARM